MTRVDVPTLKCDRCGHTTQALNEMGVYRTISGMYDNYQGAKEKWDLCPNCWADFIDFMFTGKGSDIS